MGVSIFNSPGEKSYKFFRERIVYDIYTCEVSGDFYEKARCHRSLRKSEDLHYLAINLKEDNYKAAVSRAHCSRKGGSGGHYNRVLALFRVLSLLIFKLVLTTRHISFDIL